MPRLPTLCVRRKWTSPQKKFIAKNLLRRLLFSPATGRACDNPCQMRHTGENRYNRSGGMRLCAAWAEAAGHRRRHCGLCFTLLGAHKSENLHANPGLDIPARVCYTLEKSLKGANGCVDKSELWF